MEMEEMTKDMTKPELKSRQINIRLTPVLYERFERSREKTGHTITDALIMLITQYCERAEGER